MLPINLIPMLHKLKKNFFKITTQHQIIRHIAPNNTSNTYLSGLEPLLIKLEFIIYLPKLKVKFILWDTIFNHYEAKIMDDGIEPTPRNMITRTKLFESKLQKY